ncbi:MAG: hypothetical protein GX159_09885 [Flavobacteriaceae bacterium]|jgi:hypothetical protein|nr:hypothetical protein [Flavobacteriaceae bacterium]
MSNINGVTIQKGKVGANRRNVKRAVSALIIGSVASADLALNTPQTVYNIEDLEQYGITPEFDSTNNLNVYRHFSEFFRMAGAGTELHFMLVDQAETFGTILADASETMAKRLLAFAKHDVRQLGVCLNPDETPTPVDGLPDDALTAIAAAQGLYAWADENHMPLQIFLEGHNLSGAANVVPDLRDIENVKATKVTYVIGQDWAYAETKTGIAQKFADVGTVLGVCSAARINQNIGDNEEFDLTDATRNAWMVPGLSNHKKNDEVYSQLQTFEDKGYVFGLEYAGLAGVRINNDHVCAPIEIDQEGNMNEHTIAYGRILDDARRQLRTVYLPKIKKTYPVGTDGKLPVGVRTSLELVGDAVFGDMQNAAEISNGKTTIDPDSDIMVEKELIVGFNLQPTGVIGYLNGTINLKQRI